MSQGKRSSIIRRFWKPVAISGAGGSATAIWFEEIILHAEAILAMIFLPILAGVICLLNIFIFRSHMPRPEDLHTTKNHGDKQ
jgi:hypothetical protein